MRTNGVPALTATFTDADADETGTLDFRVCADPACSDVRGIGSSTTVPSGTAATWGSGLLLPDGTHYWQARARDSLGGVSPWTAARSFTLDRAAPPAPAHFSGALASDGLTLRWAAPSGEPVGGYVLYVEDSVARRLSGATTAVNVGSFGAADRRSFAVAAVDEAGNEGARTAALVGVPALTNLPLDVATAALASRGLALGTVTEARSPQPPNRVLAYTPGAPAVVARGSAVDVVVSEPLFAVVNGRNVRCAPRGVLRLTVALAADARLDATFRGKRWEEVESRALGSFRAGTRDIELRLPRAFAKSGRYWVVLRAQGRYEGAQTSVRVLVDVRAGATGRVCRPEPLV